MAADTLPLHCGDAGVQRYANRTIPKPINFAEPPLLLQRGRLITVVNVTDAMNGDVGSVARLETSPGSDGISLREAITATNNDPGVYTIRFASGLRGSSIQLPETLQLSGGSVTLDGDIDGDRQPDITVARIGMAGFGVSIESSGNVVHALRIQGFDVGILFQATAPNRVHNGNVIQNNIVDATFGGGIIVGANNDGTRWLDTLIAGNTVQSQSEGISVNLHRTARNTVERLTIRNNRIRSQGAVMLVAGWSRAFETFSTENRIADVVISDNYLEGPGGAIISGAEAQRNVIESVHLSGNTIYLPTASASDQFGFLVIAGDSEIYNPSFRPIAYPDENRISNLWITGTQISGKMADGIVIRGGGEGGSGNTLRDIFLLANTINAGDAINSSSSGIVLQPGGGEQGRPSADNRMQNVVVQGNTIRLSPRRNSEQAAGIYMVGSTGGGTRNLIRDVWISHNDIDGNGNYDIQVLGAWGDSQSPTAGNRISRVEIWCNLAQNSRPDVLRTGLKPIAINGGLYTASSNTVELVRATDNLARGVLNDISVVANVTPESVSNVATLMPAAAPTVPDVLPGRIVNEATAKNEPVAPGFAVTFSGANLASATAAAASSSLPTQLGGTTVRINDLPAPLYSVSPTEIRFQVPPQLAGTPIVFITVIRDGVAGLSQPLPLSLGSFGTMSFSLSDRGAVSLTSAGGSAPLSRGYARVQPGGPAGVAGVAVFSFRQDNVLVSEAGVPASSLMLRGRIFAHVAGAINTGLAMANPGNQIATISFYFTDQNGVNFGAGTTTIPANGQIAAFLNESPFNGGATIEGTFTFTSTAPVSVIALRGLTNERSEFLMTTLPVSPIAPDAQSSEAILFPHFADGGGWITQIILVNSTDQPITGAISFWGQGTAAAAAQAVTVNVGSQVDSAFTYAIPPRSSRRFQTSGPSTITQAGSVRVIPSSGSAPSGLAVFSFSNGGVTVTEAGIPATRSGAAFRIYVEQSGMPGQLGAVQTGIGVANTSNAPVSLSYDLTTLSGASTGLIATQTIAAGGQTAIFLNQIPAFQSMTTPFQGVLRISSAPTGISVVGLRGRYNERGDFLITTIPALNESTMVTSAELFFPHVVNGAGFSTQFLLLGAQPSSGMLRFVSQHGEPMMLQFR